MNNLNNLNDRYITGFELWSTSKKTSDLSQWMDFGETALEVPGGFGLYLWLDIFQRFNNCSYID